MLLPEHIERIIGIFANKKDVKYISVSIDNNKIAENDYNLSVSSYIEVKDKREIIDIAKLNEKLELIVKQIDHLREDIHKIIKGIE